MAKRLALLAIFFFPNVSQARSFADYLAVTYQALECLRAPTGLLKDRAFFQAANANEECSLSTPKHAETSPTNIALDLILQMDLLKNPIYQERAAENLKRVLTTLSTMPFHAASGLFFNRYDQDNPQTVAQSYVSTVDNMHLYLALWTLSQEPFHNAVASALVRRMNFKSLVEESTGLLFGGLEYANDTWKPVGWTYRHMGSEARIGYFLGHVLDLFPTEMSPKNWIVEKIRLHENKEQLVLWDGGAFQLLLPELLVSESFYSAQFRTYFANYLDYIYFEQKRRNLLSPAAHSASQILVEGDAYNGFSGSRALVSRLNANLLDVGIAAHWEEIMSPHALFLAGLADWPRVLRSLVKLEQHFDLTQVPFYNQKLGWFDGVYVEGPQRGRIVPAILALDDLMIALVSVRILAEEKQLATALAISKNPKLRRKAESFFRMFL